MKSSFRPDASELIGKRLQKYYENNESQALPDQFKTLLARIDKAASLQQETQSDKLAISPEHMG
jgi:Anti-sigma factor NepR